MSAFLHLQLLFVLNLTACIDGDCYVNYCRFDSCEGLTCTACLDGNYLTNAGLCSGCWPYCTQCTEYLHCTQCARGKWGYLCQEDCSWCDNGCDFNTGNCLSAPTTTTSKSVINTSIQSSSTKNANAKSSSIERSSTSSSAAQADTVAESGPVGGNDNMDSSSNNGGSQDTSLTENKHTIEEKESNSNTGLVVGLAVGVSLVVVAVIVVVMIFYRRKNRKNGRNRATAGVIRTPLSSGIAISPPPVVISPPRAQGPFPALSSASVGAIPSAPMAHMTVQYTPGPPPVSTQYINPVSSYIPPSYIGDPNTPGPIINRHPHPRPTAPTGTQLDNVVNLVSGANDMVSYMGDITGNVCDMASTAGLGTVDSGYTEVLF